jgi:DNA-directed RNA polymerase subunit beta'
VKLSTSQGKVTIQVRGSEGSKIPHSIPPGFEAVVKVGDTVKERQVLAKSVRDKSTVRATTAGTVNIIRENEIILEHEGIQEQTYELSANDTLLVKNGKTVSAGEPLNAGHYNLQELLVKRDKHTVQRYIVSQVQHIYASQGQTINDKHLEIIARKMFSKLRILDAGSTPLLVGDVVDLSSLQKANREAEEVGKKPAVAEQLLLGLSRVSLATDSWLAAASFQETIRVLVEAATTKKIDPLDGLKENVIIGRLIPAGETYRRMFTSSEEEVGDVEEGTEVQETPKEVAPV